MNDITTYQTIKTEVQVKVPVGACRFFGNAAPITTEEEAKHYIERIKNKYPDATHHVWAYKLGIDEQALIRSTDDGEPANSAGPPVVQAIRSAEVTNVVVVITRYYGGVKQGFGGLIRAYRGTAAQALAAATKVEYQIYQQIKIGPVDYSHIGNIIHQLERVKGTILKIDYQQEVYIRARIKPHVLANLKPVIRDVTKGKASIKEGDMLWQSQK